MIKFGNTTILPLNSPFRKNYADLNETIKSLIDDLYKNAQHKISDDRFYQAITQGIVNGTKELNAKGLAFTISQDSDKFNGHLLEVSMLLPSMKEIKRPLAYGNSKKILDFLKDKESLKVIKKDLLEMSADGG